MVGIDKGSGGHQRQVSKSEIPFPRCAIGRNRQHIWCEHHRVSSSSWLSNDDSAANWYIFALFGQLTRDDIDMLREMKFLAQSVVQVHGRTIDEFKIGYHAKPSMQRVHLHVISRDFHSPCLKTKKHWNSFNTPFLLSTECKLFLGLLVITDNDSFTKFISILSDVIDQLEQSGRVQKLQEQTIKDYLASPLKCNSCQARLRNIPELKEHLARHIAAPIAGNDSWKKCISSSDIRIRRGWSNWWPYIGLTFHTRSCSTLISFHCY